MEYRESSKFMINIVSWKFRDKKVVYIFINLEVLEISIQFIPEILYICAYRW